MEIKKLKKILKSFNKIDFRSKNSILNTVMFEKMDDNIIMRRNDLSQEMVFRIPFNDDVVSSCYDFNDIKKIITISKQDVINMKFESNGMNHFLVIEDGKKKYRIKNVGAVEDFPISEKGTKYNMKFNSPSIRKAIKKIMFSTTQSSANACYAGIHFEETDGIKDIISTDLHRMSLVVFEKDIMEWNFDAMQNVKKDVWEWNFDVLKQGRLDINVHIETLKTASEIFPDFNSFTFDEEKITFSDEFCDYTSRLLPREFPQYRTILKENEYKHFITPDFNELNDFLDSCCNLTVGAITPNKITNGKDDFGNDFLLFKWNDGKLELESKVNFQHHQGEDFNGKRTFTFDGKKLFDCVKNFKEFYMSFHESEDFRMLLIRHIGEDSEYRIDHYLMPLRI